MMFYRGSYKTLSNIVKVWLETNLFQASFPVLELTSGGTSIETKIIFEKAVDLIKTWLRFIVPH